MLDLIKDQLEAMQNVSQSAFRTGTQMANRDLLSACKAALKHLKPGTTLPLGSNLELIQQLESAIASVEGK